VNAPIFRSVLSVFCLGLTLVFVALPAAAEMTMRIQWTLNGPPSELIAFIREGRALQAKLNPEVKHELWFNDVHGANTNRVSLLVRYRDAVHYAEATAREEASAEWRSFLERFPEERFPTTFVGFSNVLSGGDLPEASDGNVMLVIVFDARKGSQQLAQWVQRGADLQAKVNPKAAFTLGVPTLAGDSVGRAVLTVRYPTLADWAAGQKKLGQSDEWAKFIADFPGDTYPIVYQGMSRAIKLD